MYLLLTVTSILSETLDLKNFKHKNKNFHTKRAIIPTQYEEEVQNFWNFWFNGYLVFEGTFLTAVLPLEKKSFIMLHCCDSANNRQVES